MEALPAPSAGLGGRWPLGILGPASSGPRSVGLPESWPGRAQGAFGAEETPDPRGVPGVGPAFPADLASQSLVLGWKKVMAWSLRPMGWPQGGLLKWGGRKSEARQRRGVVQPYLIQSPVNSKGPE